MPRSKPRALKNLTLGLLVACFLLVGAETAQRVRYGLRYGHSYWLKYGFVPRPKDYRAHMERHVLSKEDAPRAASKEEATADQAPPELERRFQFFTLHYEGYYKFRPGTYKLKGRGVEGVSYTINSHGLRGREFDSPKPAGVVRILCLGGSSTFGIFNGDDDTYPALLERLLAADGLRKYDVLNGGFSGASLKDLGAFFAADRSALEPDIVVIYSLFNNIFQRQFQSPPEALAWRLRRWLSDRSLLFITALEKYSIWRYGGAFAGAGRYDFRGLGRWIDEERVWMPFRDDLSALIEDARGHGVRVMLVKQALKLDVGAWASLLKPAELWQAHLDTARRIIDEAGRKHGVPVLDAQPLFPPEDSGSMFQDPVHLTDAGNAVLAKAIYMELLELGWTR